ncbi:hypothetical protein GCM10009821_08970 [Aeromicrobium halocynthiae]|uniref:LPXTG cell wall anchor domain-containing protein n=1 Tax=Aeromicrobium halocynthiae TaxID=560557 RepID=A0ABN2VUL1_9ACTN
MRRLLLLPVLALVGVMFVASPANAATVDLSVDETTITAGGTVTLSWVVLPEDGGATTLTASSTPATSFDGEREALTDEEDVVLTEPGEYTFTLSATEDGVTLDGTGSVTVTVAPAPTIIDVPAVTFPDPCTVVLPPTENVSYGVGFGGFGNEVPAGTLDLADYFNGGFPVEFTAVPDEGFAFPEGATSRFPVTVSPDCLGGEIVESGLVETSAVCQGVTFTNVSDDDLFVLYGDEDEDRPDGEFELAVGASRTIDTERDLIIYVAIAGSEEVVQINEVEVEQDCARAAALHPTVAPAAGSGTGGSAAGLGALAALTLAGGAALGARRLRRTA